MCHKCNKDSHGISVSQLMFEYGIITMCYIVFIRSSFHWCSIRIKLLELEYDITVKYLKVKLM